MCTMKTCVRPRLILHSLNWLKINNPLYSEIGVNMENIQSSLVSLNQDQVFTSKNDKVNIETNNGCLDSDESITEITNFSNENSDILSPDFDIEILDSEDSIEINMPRSEDQQNVVEDHTGITDDNEEDDDPMNEHRTPTNETCLQSIIPDYPITTAENDLVSQGNEIFNIAPGENKHPVAFMMDKQCEELAFPVLFPRGRFGYIMLTVMSNYHQLNILMHDYYIILDALQQIQNIYFLHNS